MKANRFAYRWRRFRIRLMNWEYWPFSLVYFPVYFYWTYLSLKARSFFFFSSSNPGIEHAGFIMESKFSIYEIIPLEYRPVTLYISKDTDLDLLVSLPGHYNITYPLVAKPDIGEKGGGVKKIHSWEELLDYHQHTKVAYILQPWVDYPEEIGIFYCRYPNEETGIVTGIVKKVFLSLKGDGVHTMEELILKSDRAFLQLPVLKKNDPEGLKRVLAKDEEFILVPYGNHSRGSLFLDKSHLIDEDLTRAIDQVCRTIPGFFYGRLDIRYEDWDLLKKGRAFSIIELNGAGSEPTHIYDPRHSVFFAWAEIMRHLKILYRISKLNRERKGIPYMSFWEGISLLKSKRRYDSLVKNNA